MVLLEASRVLLCVVMLGYASWSDLKTREVSDVIWIVFGGIGLFLDAYEVVWGSLRPLSLAVPIIFSATLSFALGYLGLFGGADFKAFVVLAVLQPYPPSFISPALGIVSVVYPLTIFSNSALAGALFALILLVRNISTDQESRPLFEGHKSEPLWRKFIILISGVKMKLESVRGPPFQYPLEVPLNEDGGRRRLVLLPDIEDDATAVEIFRKLRIAGIEEVWVSHTLPFLVFIALGYLSTLLLGDLALRILEQILSP